MYQKTEPNVWLKACNNTKASGNSTDGASVDASEKPGPGKHHHQQAPMTTTMHIPI